MEKQTTGSRLKLLMEERKIKQVDIVNLAAPFCSKFNVKLNKSDLSQYISEKFEPSQEKLVVLGMALNVSEAWLMGFDVPRERYIASSGSPDPQEQYLVTAYRSFNDDGRDRLVRYAHDLDDTGKYARDRKPDKTKEEAEAAYIKSRSDSAQKPDASASNTIGEGKSETA